MVRARPAAVCGRRLDQLGQVPLRGQRSATSRPSKPPGYLLQSGAMDTYHVLLYIHFISLLIGFGAASVVVVCLFKLRSAQTVADAVPWGMLAGQTERVFPIAILGLFGSGAYMTSKVWT